MKDGQYGIFYLMSHPAHLPYLVTSLWTLRKHWPGPVRVYAWKYSIEWVRWIGADTRLEVDVIEREPAYLGKNDQFLDKIKIAQMLRSDFESVLYLDADTTIHGSLGELFRLTHRHSFVATQFCNWTSNGSVVRARIKRLREFDEIPDDLIEDVISNPYPSVNGGIWACRPTSPVLETWYNWTWPAREKVFIADEAVLHLLSPHHPVEMCVVTGGKYNCSTIPKWFPKGLTHDDIVIWHYHGDSNVRPEKSPEGVRQWFAILQECLDKNIGGIADWYDEVGPKNKWIRKLMEMQDAS